MNRHERDVVSALEDIVAAKPHLRVNIVGVFDHPDDTPDSATQRKIVKGLKSVVFCQVLPATFSGIGDWIFAPRRYVDKHGEFVENKALDVNEDVWEILPDIEHMFKRVALY